MKRVLSSFLLFSILVGCRSQQFAPIRYSNSILNPVYDSTKSESSTLNSWLQPYRAQLSAALDSQLFISCRTAGKKQPQSAIGNHLTEVMKEYATSELNATVDAAMLNYGGIRAALPRGSAGTGGRAGLAASSCPALVTHTKRRRCGRMGGGGK